MLALLDQKLEQPKGPGFESALSAADDDTVGRGIDNHVGEPEAGRFARICRRQDTHARERSGGIISGGLCGSTHPPSLCGSTQRIQATGSPWGRSFPAERLFPQLFHRSGITSPTPRTFVASVHSPS